MGTVYDLEKMNKTLKKYLDSDRFIHTQGVRYTAAAMAMAHGADLGKAELAGLLHDCAKNIPDKEQLRLCTKHKIPLAYDRHGGDVKAGSDRIHRRLYRARALQG